MADGVKGGENADIFHTRVLRHGAAVAVDGHVLHHVDVDDLAVEKLDDGLRRVGLDSRKAFCSVVHIASGLPAPWMFALPALDAHPMESCLSAPPKPPIGWPLKWERTSMES